MSVKKFRLFSLLKNFEISISVPISIRIQIDFVSVPKCFCLLGMWQVRTKGSSMGNQNLIRMLVFIAPALLCCSSAFAGGCMPMTAALHQPLWCVIILSVNKVFVSAQSVMTILLHASLLVFPQKLTKYTYYSTYRVFHKSPVELRVVHTYLLSKIQVRDN